jgi:hypothetical protein
LGGKQHALSLYDQLLPAYSRSMEVH